MITILHLQLFTQAIINR